MLSRRILRRSHCPVLPLFSFSLLLSAPSLAPSVSTNDPRVLPHCRAEWCPLTVALRRKQRCPLSRSAVTHTQTIQRWSPFSHTCICSKLLTDGYVCVYGTISHSQDHWQSRTCCKYTYLHPAASDIRSFFFFFCDGLMWASEVIMWHFKFANDALYSRVC